MKSKIHRLRTYFSKGELILWSGSATLILLSFFLLDRENYETMIASLIGITSLLFNAKGNPIGQLLMLLFSIFYGAISYAFSYYGEMLTYLGMTAPMAAIALLSWLRHPYQGKKAQVAVNRLSLRERGLILPLTAIVTWIFYYLLATLHTANLLPSTLSVATSFIAAYLTFRRSAYFALAYAANDVVLIVLWALAAETDSSYWSVVTCFALFLINDLYGFFQWLSMRRRQEP